MSKTKTIDEIRSHKDNSISILNKYLDSLLADDPKKADLLAYWLHTYTNYLKFEPRFDPKKNKNYERGDIVCVDLGFNIGSEHGGRHYAVVLDNKNHHASPIVTIIPLSSSDGNDVHPSSVYLGDDIYQKISAKIKGMRQAYAVEQRELEKLKATIQAVLTSETADANQIATAEANRVLIDNKTSALKTRQLDLQKVQQEINKMKIGSVALIGQITTISKIRIVDPVNIHGALNGIKLSSVNLDLIDDKIRELFLHEQK